MIPSVCFVIRTLDEAVWLPRVLKKLFAQTYHDFEIIFVDSGSTDGTLEIIANTPKSRLLQIPKPTFNYSYALNLGISQTKYEYICIISGHSLPISDTWLEAGIRHFNDPKVVGVTGYYTDLPDAPIRKQINSIFQIQKWKFLSPKHCWKHFTNTNALIRKSTWEKYPFDQTLPECEDYDWALEMLANGNDIVLEPKFGVRHSHWHKPGSKTWEERKIKWESINSTIESYPTYSD